MLIGASNPIWCPIHGAQAQPAWPSTSIAFAARSATVCSAPTRTRRSTTRSLPGLGLLICELARAPARVAARRVGMYGDVVHRVVCSSPDVMAARALGRPLRHAHPGHLGCQAVRGAASRAVCRLPCWFPLSRVFVCVCLFVSLSLSACVCCWRLSCSSPQCGLV